VALHLGEKDPEQFRPALEAIKAASKDSLAEVRQLLGVLRDDAPLSPAPPPRLSQIPALADNARRTGLEVSLSQPDPNVTSQLPDAVQEAAYRIVQEALTNVVRHAGARQAAVVLAVQAAGPVPATGDGLLTVTVDDDGAGAAGVPDGNGVTGMRERTAALGGTLELAPLDPGWRVRAVIPVPGEKAPGFRSTDGRP
jgi:signal transduction histidine kinase